MSDARMHAALTRVDALHEALDASRAREAKLVEALQRIATGAGDSITGHLTAAACRRVAARTLADHSGGM